VLTTNTKARSGDPSNAVIEFSVAVDRVWGFRSGQQEAIEVLGNRPNDGLDMKGAVIHMLFACVQLQTNNLVMYVGM